MAGAKTGGSTSASAIRIRENQRRSRARRKEYVESMERKVQEYERRGVEATLEMQQAARTVAVENSRLRMMLAQMGAATADVDAFLQAVQDRDAAHTLSTVRFQPGPDSQTPSCCGDDFGRRDENNVCTGVGGLGVEGAQGGRICPQVFPGPLHNMEHAQATSSQPMASWAAFDKLDVLASASVQQGCCDTESRCSMPGLGSSAESPSTAETSPGVTTPPPSGLRLPSPGPAAMESPMSMSCDAAAQIIADMQGYSGSSRGSVKEEPGCTYQNGCPPRNNVLLQALDSRGRI
ncbi:hypothetical protein HIM_06115 [Hirsutella minnesotensis 3608]|uniref:BZIP domain-containing protein n=1 Tax=Hirsutella minnesotensis 3608 TaxID=1043627 RepID=A0A0F8A511_9HYPO|nr:hypothetical protein HIM_06115 [Hirsutella minnesotensis 3608]